MFIFYALKRNQSGIFCLAYSFCGSMTTVVRVNVELKQGKNIQEQLLNKLYVNEVTLRGQKPPLKCCYPLDFSYIFTKSLYLLLMKIWGMYIKGL